MKTPIKRYGRPKRLVRNGTPSEFLYVRVNDGGARSWRSTGATTQDQAEKVIQGWRDEDAGGTRHVKEKSVREAAEAWLKAKREKGIAGTTATVFAVFVRSWSKHFGRRPLRSVTLESVERYLRLRSGKLSLRSLNNERQRLRSFFKWCIGRKWLRENPAAGVEPYLEEKKRVRALREDDERRLLAEAKAGGEDLYGFTLCLLASGLRKGTVAKLEFKDVDWDHGEWQIPAHKMKSREDFLERPIDPDLFAYLKARRKPAGRIFGVLDPEKWEAAVVRAGLNWVTPHTARRTFITRCRRRKVPMEVCMFLSDHRSRSVVIESYLDVGVTPGEAKQALADAAVGKLARKEGGA